MLSYDRLTDEEKLEKYIEFESDLFIYKQKPKSEEILELTAKLEKNQEITDKLETKLVNLEYGFKIYDSLTHLPHLPTKEAYELIQRLKKRGIGKFGFEFDIEDLKKAYEKEQKTLS